MSVVKTSAPGAVFLFGEHSVVYGYPSLNASVSGRVRVGMRERKDRRLEIRSRELGRGVGEVVMGERPGVRLREGKFSYVAKALELVFSEVGEGCGLEVEVSSDLPVGAGLSSSSATSVATIAAALHLLGEKVDPKKVVELAFRTELEIQSVASRAGVSVATYGGFLRMEGKKVRRIPDLPTPGFVVGNTGVFSATGPMVRKVRRLREERPREVEALFRLMGTITDAGLRSLREGDLRRTGALMNANQACLAVLGVSSPALERLIRTAREAGAYGAKLTGGGGGGCMLALCPGREEEVSQAIRRAGGKPLSVTLGGEGLRVESE
ncbi:MAG: mevalonate kinase [Candidatus Hadarchaeales archaeon]